MRGDVLDPLAVDADLAAVVQTFEIFLARERPPIHRVGICFSSATFFCALKIRTAGCSNFFCADFETEFQRLESGDVSVTIDNDRSICHGLRGAFRASVKNTVNASNTVRADVGRANARPRRSIFVDPCSAGVHSIYTIAA
jgi:hypothetical protein